MTKESLRKTVGPQLAMQHLRLCRIGPRDLQILTALDRCPLTIAQLMRLSQTFVTPFPDASVLRRRLRRLAKAGYVKYWPYAVATEGRSPNYFRLGRDGYSLLYGADSPLPHRRRFEALSPVRHHHTFCLAELIVQVFVSAHLAGCSVDGFGRENSVCFKSGSFTMYPDCSFVIRRPDGRTFPYVVELDNSSERVRSRLDVESIERKIRGYDAHQSKFASTDPDRYLVLFVATRSQRRVQNILDLASTLMQQPRRTVFVGCKLDSFLASNPFDDAILQDHRGLKRMLIPRVDLKSRQSGQQQPAVVLT